MGEPTEAGQPTNNGSNATDFILRVPGGRRGHHQVVLRELRLRHGRGVEQGDGEGAPNEDEGRGGEEEARQRGGHVVSPASERKPSFETEAPASGKWTMWVGNRESCLIHLSSVTLVRGLRELLAEEERVP